jgi:hypothetical protein
MKNGVPSVFSMIYPRVRACRSEMASRLLTNSSVSSPVNWHQGELGVHVGVVGLDLLMESPRRHLELGAKGAEEDDGHLFHEVDHVGQQLDGLRISPMEVVHDEDGRPGAGDVAPDATYGGEQLALERIPLEVGAVNALDGQQHLGGVHRLIPILRRERFIRQRDDLLVGLLGRVAILESG